MASSFQLMLSSGSFDRENQKKKKKKYVYITRVAKYNW